MEEWENKKRSVTLTNDEWTLVELYLDYGIKERKSFIETIERVNRLLPQPDPGLINHIDFTMDQISDISNIMNKLYKRA